MNDFLHYNRFHFPEEINCIVSSSNMAYVAGFYWLIDWLIVIIVYWHLTVISQIKSGTIWAQHNVFSRVNSHITSLASSYSLLYLSVIDFRVAFCLCLKGSPIFTCEFYMKSLARLSLKDLALVWSHALPSNMVDGQKRVSLVFAILLSKITRRLL